jgi:hypothetical protein
MPPVQSFDPGEESERLDCSLRSPFTSPNVSDVAVATLPSAKGQKQT